MSPLPEHSGSASSFVASLAKLYECCELCPRRCKAHRSAGQLGLCGASDSLEIARAALHFWEEPIISGTAGSGAVFFSHCPLACVYCQNSEISRDGRGAKVGTQRLVEIFLELQQSGAHNINLVTPTHYVPTIVQAISSARDKGLVLPIVYNTSGYEKVETLRLLKGFVDIYLTDFKYWDESLGKRYSAAADYGQVALEALDEMFSQVGPPRYQISNCSDKAVLSTLPGSGDGTLVSESYGAGEEAVKLMISGVIVRHLMLPASLEDSKQVLRRLSERYGNNIVLSLMNQYTPRASLERYPELQGRVTSEEYEVLLDLADEIYQSDYYWQEGDAANESFIPSFDGTGVLSASEL